MVSWGPDLVAFRHDLVTKGEGQLLSFFDCSGPR